MLIATALVFAFRATRHLPWSAVSRPIDVSGPPPPPLDDLGPGPYGPVLLVERDHFQIDGRPKFLYFVSFFDGLREASASLTRLDEDLAYIKDTLDADGIRVFPNWGIWSPAALVSAHDTLFDPSDPAHPLRSVQLTALKALLRSASIHDLVVDLTFTRETLPEPGMTVQAYKAALVAVARELRDYRNVLVDIQNEFDMEQRLTEAQVKDIRLAINAPDGDPLRIVTASPSGSYTPESTGRFASEAGLSVAAHHDSRVRETWYLESTLATIVSAVRTGAGQRVVPIYLQEPTGWGDGPHDDRTPGHFKDAASAAKKAGVAAWTFHQRAGFNLQRESFQSHVAADAALRAEMEGIRAWIIRTGAPASGRSATRGARG